MKVVVFSRFPHDINQPRGGVETATLGLLKGLAKHKEIDLHVVTLEKDVDEARVDRLEWVTVHRLPKSGWPLFLDILYGPGRKRVDDYIRGLAPDIVHFQETYGIGAGDVGAPNIFTVHGFDSLNLPTSKPRFWRLRSAIWRYVESKGLVNQKYIVSITPYVRDEIEAKTAAKIVDIDNAIDEKYFSLPHDEIKGRIFFAGWLNARKNPITLVKAFAKLVEKGVDAELRIAGEASDSDYFNRLQETIEKEGVKDKVVLLGRLNQQQIQQELQNTALFVLPSYQENAPMAIAEAMAVGIPVVSSNVCGMPYMIEEGRTGYLVDPDDIPGLADKMAKLLLDDEGRREMGKECKEEAYRRYHPDSVARKTVDLYQQVIASS